MPKLPDGLTNVSLSSDSEYDHALHDLSLQVNASAEDSKNENNASHDSTNSQPNFTEVSIYSRSVETTGDTENGCGTSGGQSGAPGGLIGEASTMPVDEEEEANRLIDQILDLQKTLDDLTSRMDSVKEDNLVLKSENQVLSQYIENVMHASSSFQQMSPKSRKREFALAKIGKLKDLCFFLGADTSAPSNSRNAKR